MSSIINRCVYSQIQGQSLKDGRRRSLPVQLIILAATTAFDIGVTAGAAVAAAAVGAHITGQPLRGQILRSAVIGGAAKAGSMAVHGLVSFGLHGNVPAILGLPLLMLMSFGTNVLAAAVVSLRVLDEVPSELLIAAVVASIPLCLSFAWYYGAFNVPITFFNIAFDALGGFTFARMADNLGYPICSGSTAAAAGAAFGAVSTVGSTLFGCCIIGHPRRQAIYNDGSAWNISTSGHLEAGWCGNRVNVYKSTHELLTGPGVSGSYNSQTTGWVQNSAHGFGWQWDTGHTRAHAGWFTMTTNDHTSTTGWGNRTETRF
ncbi:hypothetical protein BJX66DRAFT_300242 [Aspergillus keveii]|uniref:Uncharacterized protein n=1 Tax=Aspergillus keveii TaxID=714993 RepID=A0ABR4GAY9_9EURO